MVQVRLHLESKITIRILIYFYGMRILFISNCMATTRHGNRSAVNAEWIKRDVGIFYFSVREIN